VTRGACRVVHIFTVALSRISGCYVLHLSHNKRLVLAHEIRLQPAAETIVEQGNVHL
jgi:hypothetical protein